MSEEVREEVKMDLEELRRLRSMAKRPAIITFLSARIHTLDMQLKEPFRAPPTPTDSENATCFSDQHDRLSSDLNYTNIGPYFRDQDDDTVRIYIFLGDVDKEKIEADFKPMSFDVKFHDVQGGNYRCHIPLLNKPILPHKCSVVVEPTKAVILLFKASNKDCLDFSSFPPFIRSDNRKMSEKPGSVPVLTPTPTPFSTGEDTFYTPKEEDKESVAQCPFRFYRPGLMAYESTTRERSQLVLTYYNEKNHTDFVLVKVVNSTMMDIGAFHFVIHVNFKAKRENEDDREAVLFFGEIKSRNNVTVCTILDDTSEIQNYCRICHPDDLIQHPVGGFHIDCQRPYEDRSYLEKWYHEANKCKSVSARDVLARKRKYNTDGNVELL